MAVFALQPDVAEFLDVVMHDEDLDFRIQEQIGALLLAIRRGAGEPFEPHPPADLVVPAGAVLIPHGTQAELDELTRLGAC